MTPPPTACKFELFDRPVAGLTWGDPELPPMLALHGWLDNAGSFARLAPLLTKQRHIVAIDLAGHGLSGNLPPGAWYHYIDHLSEISAVIDQLDWARCDLLGHSMGGSLALLWSVAFPERVDRLICIDALGALADEPGDTAARLRKGVLARARWRPESNGRIYPTREAAIAARRRNRHLTKTDAELLAERSLEQTAAGFRWRFDRRHYLPSMTRLTEEQVLGAMAASHSPTLYIRATDSEFKLPDREMQTRLNALPDAQLVELGGGHHLHIDQAEDVARAISGFLS